MPPHESSKQVNKKGNRLFDYFMNLYFAFVFILGVFGQSQKPIEQKMLEAFGSLSAEMSQLVREPQFRLFIGTMVN